MIVFSGTVWKNEKFSLIEKIFREINNYFSKTVAFTKLLSKKRERNLLSLHNVEKREIFFHSLKKQFRQMNNLVISLVKPLLSRNLCEKV